MAAASSASSLDFLAKLVSCRNLASGSKPRFLRRFQQQRQREIAVLRPVGDGEVEHVAVRGLHREIEPHPVRPAGEARHHLAPDGLDDAGGLQTRGASGAPSRRSSRRPRRSPRGSGSTRRSGSCRSRRRSALSTSRPLAFSRPPCWPLPRVRRSSASARYRMRATRLRSSLRRSGSPNRLLR